MGIVVIGLAIGALLPLAIAAVMLFLGSTRGLPVDFRFTLSFAKGIALGAAGGALVSVVIVVMALALRER